MQLTVQVDHRVLNVLFDHNTWANLKLLDFCEGLSDEQLDTSAIGTYGSIRDTLWHLVGAELSYVYRVNGKLPADPPTRRGGFPGFAALNRVARWAGEELPQLAQSARADTLVEERSEDEKVVVRYPLASLMLQALNHSTEHRAQVSTIITQLGLVPPEMDGWKYMEEQGEFQETTEA
jgi:uncharacterized damage-inducible protein DinB